MRQGGDRLLELRQTRLEVAPGSRHAGLWTELADVLHILEILLLDILDFSLLHLSELVLPPVLQVFEDGLAADAEVLERLTEIGPVADALGGGTPGLVL